MRKIKLGDVLDVKRGTSLSGEFYAEAGERIRLTLGNFNYPSGGFKENTSKKNIYFTGDVKEEFILKKGDIITPLTEQVSGLLGETAKIPKDDLYIQSGDIGLIIPNEKLLNRLFAYYLLSSPIVKKQLDSAAQQTKIRHTSPEKIKDCEVWLPDMEHQKRTGILLDAINEKIINNNKINDELESMAKTIYDYWFLQFDFPDENGRPYKSSGGKMVWNNELKRELPEGWRVADLKDIASITMGTSPKGDSINTDGKGIVFYQGKADFGNRFPVTRTYTSAPIRYADANDILLSVRAPVGTLNIANKKCCIGRGLAAIHSKYSSFMYYIMLANQYKFDIYNNGGTTFGAITKDDLFGMRVVVPKEFVIEKFEKRTNCINQEIFRNNDENQELISLRDFLLPLLMNGQVRFKK